MARPEGWHSEQSRTPEGAVESEQRVTATRPAVERSERGARRLGSAYWQELGRASLGLVRLREGGGGIALRVLGRGPALLAFGPPELSWEGETVACRHEIRGGLLARHPGGSIVLAQTDRDLSARVSGFFPRRGPFYERIQRRLHASVSRRYFRRLLGAAPP